MIARLASVPARQRTETTALTTLAPTVRGTRLLAVAALVCALALAAAAPADAQWRPVVRSCASDGAVAGCTTNPSAFSGAWNVAVSPDGKHAYGASWSGTGGLNIFDRNPATC